MKTMRVLLAALTISLFSAACSATDITSPETPTEINKGLLGSGMG